MPLLNFEKTFLRAIVTVLGLLVLAGVASADSLLGVPVVASGSTTPSVPNCPTLEGQSCFNPVNGSIGFFIPLNSAHGGIYGVTPHSGGTAGTYADTGSGASNSLIMYLMFAPVNLPVSAASLTFSFVDLDLQNVNDPYGFFETVQFYNNNGVAITPKITTNGQSGGGSLAYTVSGNHTYQTIYFPNVTSLVQNPFYVELIFGSKSSFVGTNTIESLIAVLNYTTQPPLPPPNQVPEPASLVLFGTGMLGVGAVLRKKRQ